MVHFCNGVDTYDITANGFYFEDSEDYKRGIDTIRNSCGQFVEEFEIQFIDGDLIDAEFAKVFDLNQANILKFMELAHTWEEPEKLRYIIYVGEGGGEFDAETDDPAFIDVDIYGVETLRELAEQFVEDGFFGDSIMPMIRYFDYDAFARTLAMEYVEADIAGGRLVYRCG